LLNRIDNTKAYYSRCNISDPERDISIRIISGRCGTRYIGSLELVCWWYPMHTDRWRRKSLLILSSR